MRTALTLATAVVAMMVSAAVPAQSVGRASIPAPATFALPTLPYAADALEPAIDAQTMTIHHGKHHQAYVTNLNKA